MISSEQRDAFAADGLLELRGFLPKDVVATAREAVLRALSRSNGGTSLWQAGQWHLNGLSRDGGIAAGAHFVKGAKRAQALRDLFTPRLREAVAALLDGAALCTLAKSPSLLFTLPNAHAWTVPRSVWHVDLPRLPVAGIAGVQAFVFLNEVRPGGGGTLVVKGSHRLVNDRGFTRSRDIKRVLKRKPWFEELFGKGCEDRQRFMEPGACVEGVPVQAVELHGGPGDVTLTDLRLLHAPAPNAADTPRMMATQRFLRDGALATLHQLYGGAEPATEENDRWKC